MGHLKQIWNGDCITNYSIYGGLPEGNMTTLFTSSLRIYPRLGFYRLLRIVTRPTMAHHYSRSEKEKWTSGPSRGSRRPPIKIPASNTTALIEENRLTLIGRPLEMNLDISLPSGEIKQVELEYENLEKHCFICYSLSHDRNDCPALRAQANARTQTPNMGISQNRTRERLEADRRRQVEKKQPRTGPAWINGSASSNSWQRASAQTPDWQQDKNFRFTYGARKDPNYQTSNQREMEATRRPTAKERLSFTREAASGSHGGSISRYNNPPSRSEWRPVAGGSKTGSQSKTVHSLVSHTPRPQREVMSPQIAATPRSRQKSDERSVPSHERRSALDRLSLSGDRIPILQDGVANSASGRLQDVNIQYLEENLEINKSGGKDIPSSSRNPGRTATEQYDPSQIRSPIRTLSEDRLHVSLRLGPLLEPDSEEDVAIPLKLKGIRESSPVEMRAAKNKSSLPVAKKRVCRSPTQGVNVKRRRVTKTQSSPRRKLLNLLLPDGSDWNLEKIRTHLPHYEAQIRRLVPSCSMEDERCTRMTNLPPVGLSSPLYPWIMWVLWTSRNKFLFEDKSFSEAEIILKAVMLAKEWQAAQPCPGKNSASSKDSITPAQAAQAAQSHQVPQVPPNALVCFSDAAWISSSGDSGLGWIAKDSKGTIQFQGSSSRQFETEVN
ncbi:hypothetical protein HID58_024909 [Brassica napus]|uniref:Zinc knuckle CX2CX4HX4C domain-containing protein n=1 Tax=Brassica napus TaxID=3708 RepID=A0ABQ8CJJ8_BRANA|nr:hypothetical protein HID58_024909 [Brassica napus]